MNAGAVVLATLVAGPCLGSFLGTAIARRSYGIDWVAGRSRCDGCDLVLPPVALVPIFSYLRQGGRARCCGAVIHPNCTLVEIACLAVPLSIWAAGMIEAGAADILLACGLGWTLIALSMTDFLDGLLPDAMTVPLAAAGLVRVVATDGNVVAHSAAAIVGYGLIYAINRSYRALRGCDGLGMGDAKLLMAAGAWCGPLALPGILLVGCLSTLGGTLAMARRDGITAYHVVPFGPGLALGAWISFLAGPLVWGPAAW